ncbi:MAG: aminotransferase class III-fold pyridoxal phosphate-dependent enzyme, partial [Coriobacteriales bacterium]|nr:aminotransferase class III-fold pyridoxal phosphate-dependent enzyme [Coriobacteriales bacterium]
EHVIAVGAQLAERLSQMPHAVEVRGAGLMRGLQLDVPVATEAVNEGLRQGLVLNHIGDSILRFLPPLVVTDEQVDEMADKLAGIIDKLAGQQ